MEIAFDEPDTRKALRAVGALDPRDIEPVLESVENLIREKWDWALPRSLLMKSFASSHLNMTEAVTLARRLGAES
ncbi:hypothetical protein D3C76_1454720 [compost metagenome]